MSEVLDPPVTGAVMGALSGLDGGLDGLDAVKAWTMPDADLLAGVGDLVRAERRLAAQRLRLLAELDLRGIGVQQGAASTAAWLRHAHRVHPGEATRWVRTARVLHHDPAGPLVPGPDAGSPARPGLRACFAVGEVGEEHVQVVLEAVDQLPDGVDPEVREQAEVVLTGLAAEHDPKALARLSRHLRHVLDPDAGDTLADAERKQVEERRLRLRDQRDGSMDVRGHLDPELAALLRSQLDPLAAPRPAEDGTPDPRTVERRNADALADVLRIAAGTDGMPTRHGARPTIAVHLMLETLERRLGAIGGWLDWSGPVSAETARRLACDAKVIPVVLGANGEPLDVGRASYTVTQPTPTYPRARLSTLLDTLTSPPGPR